MCIHGCEKITENSLRTPRVSCAGADNVASLCCSVPLTLDRARNKLHLADRVSVTSEMMQSVHGVRAISRVSATAVRRANGGRSARVFPIASASSSSSSSALASRARVATAATPWSTTPLGGARTLVRASAAAAAPTADAPKPILLSEYAPPEYTYVSVFLEFDLGEEFTTVSNTCSVEPRVPPVSSGDSNGPLFLNGDVPSMDLVSVTIDGVVLTLDKEYTLSQKGMTIAKPPSKLFELKITTKLTPAENTELEGLYKTSGNFCTQCEAEGFRRITYFQDRPDVMSVFTTKITADKQKYPVLLSNGNLTRSGDCEDDAKKHFTTWNDPFPKPSYLFALVAGNLGCVNDTFTTMSGRTVQLKIYVEHHNLDKTEWAMVSLKKSMKWDEDVFGLEYDLDLFNIVAVDDFNMGAMENKSLNIFNSRLILATPTTATDADYAAIEGVVAHEYFHNWTGNRVTCRDWFQLSLKEGLTVYRDQEFSSDMNSRGVKRIGDVSRLRASQFPQDAGPMAHAIRPEEYIKMDNFYTVTVYEKGPALVLSKIQAHCSPPLVECTTFRNIYQYWQLLHSSQSRLFISQLVTVCPSIAIYSTPTLADSRLTVFFPEKGAEVVRMYETLLGKGGFRKGMDLYFERHDGQAVTCDDFLNAMADANAFDLEKFKPWYSQAGTPEVTATWTYDGEAKTFEMTLTQNTPDTPGQRYKKPVLMPVSVGLVGPDGKDMALHLENEDASDRKAATYTKTLQFSEATATFTFVNVSEKPVPSILRDFSAPVKLTTPLTKDDLIFLLANDSDLFNKWEAGQTLWRQTLLSLIDDVGAGRSLKLDGDIVEAMRVIVGDASSETADKAFIARAMSLPSESELSELCVSADPDVIRAVRDFVLATLARALKQELELGLSSNSADTYARDGDARAKRSLKNTCLAFLSRLEEVGVDHECLARFKRADNMTDQVAALACLVNRDCPERTTALTLFYDQWQTDGLIMNKWLGLQASSSLPGNVENVKQLMTHPAFDIKNPNKVYSLIGGFLGSPSNFHAADGSGYQMLGDVVLRLDTINGSVAARMVSGFTRWRKYDETRRTLMKAQLTRIVNTEGLSENVYEIVAKSLE